MLGLIELKYDTLQDVPAHHSTAQPCTAKAKPDKKAQQTHSTIRPTQHSTTQHSTAQHGTAQQGTTQQNVTIAKAEHQTAQHRPERLTQMKCTFQVEAFWGLGTTPLPAAAP